LKEKGLFKPKVDAHGILDPNYFLELCKFIGERSAEQKKDHRAQRVAERRQLYSEEISSEYEAKVKEVVELDAFSLNYAIQEVIKCIGVPID